MKPDRGGVLVEFAAVFPIGLFVILVCFEGLMVGTTVERVENATRTGARVAAQQQDSGACTAAATGALPGWLNEHSVTSGSTGPGVFCRVRAQVPVVWPGIPLDFEVDRTVHMPVG